MSSSAKKEKTHKKSVFQPPNFSTIPLIDRLLDAGEQHLRKRGFLRVTVPRIVPASGSCENVDTLFEVYVGGQAHWFQVLPEGKSEKPKKKRVYFAQTGQLYLESLLGKGGFEKLYCLGPSARAEGKVDTRHLTEFEMVEIEFRGTFPQLLAEIELYIGALVKSVLAVDPRQRKRLGLPTSLSHLEKHPAIFPKLNYAEAIRELGLTWGDDISSAGEQELIRNHGGGPIFIIRYPNPESEKMKKILAKSTDKKAIKFFNMQSDPADPDHVLSADCIVPYGGECVGSAARVWQYEEFKQRLFSSLMFKRLKEKDPEAKLGFAWYLDMLKTYPSVPHAGCGFGQSRIFQYLLAEPDITKAVTFPSNRQRVY
ncbi:MAG: amino acid--tRNA ligase-related protein [Patescibacteria group bacterium]